VHITRLHMPRDGHQFGVEPPREIALDDESCLAGVGRVDEDGGRDAEALDRHHATSLSATHWRWSTSAPMKSQ
jgi:hypothetical protein